MIVVVKKRLSYKKTRKRRVLYYLIMILFVKMGVKIESLFKDVKLIFI